MRLSVRSGVCLGIAALGFAPGAWAQGCVLCYTALASSGPAAMHAFQVAMFALSAPVRPVLKIRALLWRFIPRGARPVEGRA